jgi:nucleolar protein 53
MWKNLGGSAIIFRTLRECPAIELIPCSTFTTTCVFSTTGPFHTMPPPSKATAAPSTSSQSSRKSKRAWRKNIDISTVTTGLENRREEIITHGRPLSEKTQNELFVIDDVGAGKDEVDKWKKNKVGKVLKQDEILGRRSAVPALLNERKRLREDEGKGRIGDGIVAVKKPRTEWVSKKEVSRIRNNLDNNQRLDLTNIEHTTPDFDLWDTPNTTTDPTTLKHDKYIPPTRPKVAPSTLSQPPIPLTSSGHPVSSVPTPAAGQSYNPTYESWDEALTLAGNTELQSEQKRLLAQQQADEKSARIAELAAKLPDRETITGLEVEGVESEWEGFETDTSRQSHGDEVSAAEMKRRKRPERKTPSQRNKILRRKKMEQLAKHEAKMSAREDHAEDIVRQLTARTQNASGDNQVATTTPAGPPTTTAESVLQLRRNPHHGPKSASVPAQTLDIVLPEDLQDSLRRLKPEGNLLRERYRNVLVNGKLEARNRTSYERSRKRQVKNTEKWWSKDFQIGV